VIKAVIFDLDNTLIDFLHFKKVCCSSAVSAMIKSGLNIPKQKGMEVLYSLYHKYDMEDSTIFQKFLTEVVGEVDYSKLAHAVNAYRKARESVMKPYPKVRKTLALLKRKGLKLAIVTDAPKIKAWLRLTAMGISDFFDVVVGFEDTGRKKPSKLPFKAALKKLGVKPSECLMVGDNPLRDMKGAHLLGMKTCFARYGFEGKIPKGKWDFEIENVSDILKIV
jgi:putative hydrolase of the HAD superfamily